MRDAYRELHSLVTRLAQSEAGEHERLAECTAAARVLLDRVPVPSKLPRGERVALALETIAEVLADGRVDVAVLK